MPLYEYKCTQCEEQIEIIQKISDPPYSHCPKCGGEMRKLISSPAIQFKGSGFYKTDYAGSSSSKSESGGSSSTEGSSKSETKGDTTKSDTKSETKSDSKSSS